jgi:lantibiotic modifying enzyme
VAGIAYALAELGHYTGQKKYLDYAEGGARLIMDKAQPWMGGVRWYAKYTPEPAKVKYQWCHGPPGMVLTFLKLYEVTKKELYRTWVHKSVMTTAKPGKYYRLGMSMCHGAPGNGDIILEAHRLLGEGRYLEAARDHAEWVRAHTLVRADGMDWKYANRSYMNGVAGIGQFFLRMAYPRRFRQALIGK